MVVVTDLQLQVEIVLYLSTMRAPSLFTQCLPGLVPHDRVNSMSVASDKEMPVSSPAVEVVPAKVVILQLYV